MIRAKLINHPSGSIATIRILQELFIDRCISSHLLFKQEKTSKAWSQHSQKDAKIRRNFEADGLDSCEIAKLFAIGQEDDVGLVGLSVGDGEGEMAMLKRMLAQFATVHYLAIDSSWHLIRNHFKEVCTRFADELQAQRLQFVAAYGASESLGTILQLAKAKTAEEFGTFFPSGMPVVSSYLGNMLGNTPHHETEVVANIFSGLRRHDRLLSLFGVSVFQGFDEAYDSSWSDFLQAAFAELLGKKLHVSTKEISKLLPKSLQTKVSAYRSAAAIEGSVYDFTCKIAGDLNTPLSSDRLAKGSAINLYSIVKFSPSSLLNALNQLGLKTIYDPSSHQMVASTSGRREYALIAAYKQH